LALAMGDTGRLLFAPLALLLKQHGVNAKKCSGYAQILHSSPHITQSSQSWAGPHAYHPLMPTILAERLGPRSQNIQKNMQRCSSEH